MKSNESEAVKYFANCFLASKVIIFNEMKILCDNIKGTNYDTILEAVVSDSRIGESHTSVPGPDGEYGFGGTCFPKDIASLNYQMTQHGLESYMVEGAKARNLQVDRAEKDWEFNKGRAVV